MSKNSSELVGLLVGTQFHQPGRAVLAHLPTGATVQLEAEPDNPYDPEAVQVFVRPQEVPESEHQALEADLLGCGWSLSDLLAEDLICLGHLGREAGKPLQIFRERNTNTELFGAASFLEAGLVPGPARLEWTNFGQDQIIRADTSGAAKGEF